MTKKLSKLSIEDVVTTVTGIFSNLKITFKNETFMSPCEDEEFPPSDEEVDPYDVIYDETENDTYESQLTFPRDRMDDVVRLFKEKFGEPTEMRGKKDEPKTDPVWKYGKEGHGQLWVYPYDDQKSYVDIRYYYTKV